MLMGGTGIGEAGGVVLACGVPCAIPDGGMGFVVPSVGGCCWVIVT